MSDEIKDASAKADAISTLSSEERAAINAMPYEEAREKFLLDEYKKNSCDLPMEKNKIYLRHLGNKDRLLI